MTYWELTMMDVMERLRRWAAVHSNRKIARETGTDRGTVSRYLAMAEALGLTRDRELTDDAVHEVAQAIQPRPLPDRSAGSAELAAHKQQISDWLERKRPLRLSKIHTLLLRDHGLSASYDTLRRYAKQELGWRKRPATVRLDDPPAGQEAQVDFGKMGLMMDTVTGRVRMLWALIVTLSFSRYQFVWPTFLQTTDGGMRGARSGVVVLRCDVENHRVRIRAAARIIDVDGGDAAEERERALRAAQERAHRLADGELEMEQPRVAEHRDEGAHPARQPQPC